MKTLIYTDNLITYDGNQLAPHWIFQRFGVLDDCMVAFLGPCDVPLSHMVDLEDVRAKAPIASPLMLHFIGEWFEDSLEVGILRQHLFVRSIYEWLLEKEIRPLRRRGNDLYYSERKLSVSICTRSPVSVLMHMALNVDTDGTPVPTSGLREMGIEPWEFARELLARFETDMAAWRKARVKVIPR